MMLITFHVYSRSPPAVIAHELLDLVVPKYLCGRGSARHEQEEVAEFAKADRTRVRRRSQERHEL